MGGVLGALLHRRSGPSSVPCNTWLLASLAASLLNLPKQMCHLSAVVLIGASLHHRPQLSGARPWRPPCPRSEAGRRVCSVSRAPSFRAPASANSKNLGRLGPARYPRHQLARVPSFLFSLFLPRSDIASEGPRAPSFESWFSPYSLRSRRRLPARSATSLPVHSSLASLCAVADAVARSLCLGPILVPCRAHHRRETLHRCAQPRLPSRLAHTHLQTGPRCRLLTPSLPRSARTLSLSLDNVFARHHVTFSNTALLDSVRSSTPGYRSPPRRAPALQHRRHPFSVMSQAFVDW